MVSLGKVALAGGIIVLGALILKKVSGGGGSAGSDSGTVGIVVTMQKRPSLDGLDTLIPQDVTVKIVGRATGGDPAPWMTLSIEMVGPLSSTVFKPVFSWDASNPFGEISPVGIGTDYSTQKTFSPNDLMLAMLSSSGYGTYQVRGRIKLWNEFGTFEDVTSAVTFKIGVAPTGTIYTAPPT